MLVRRIHKRGANIVVEANGEVLFAPTGDVGRWTNRFSHRVRNFAALEAPVNKRPRWAHHGKPLKTTFTASTVYQPGRMRVYAAVGSSAPHAYYVDQGTGVFNGKGPYPAKILPPWFRGSPSLYEHTWRVPEARENQSGQRVIHFRKVDPVMIKGQKGQFFFDKGLRRGFQSMRMRSFQVPSDGRITEALSTFPTGLENFAGNTVADAAFMSSLTEWRAWRDEAWGAKRLLGVGYVRERYRREYRDTKRRLLRDLSSAQSRADRARESALRSKRWRARQAQIKKPNKPRPLTTAQKHAKAIQADRQRFVQRATARYPSARGWQVTGIEFRNGRWHAIVIAPNGTTKPIQSSTQF